MLLLITVIVTTAGFATALPPLVTEQVRAIWPWPKTISILLFAYSTIILGFAAFLTYQQNWLLSIHRRTEQNSQRHLSRLYALLNVSQIMGAETRLQEVFDCITRTSLDTFACEQASLMLLDGDSRTLEVRSAFGHADPALLIGRRRAMGEGVAGWVAKHRQPLLLGPTPDGSCPPDVHLADPEISAAMVVPIILRDELVGVINVSARTPGVRFDEEDFQALQVFASNAGVCIRHTEHVAWMRQLVRGDETKSVQVEAK